jgi:CheY-like chemotaxis protein
MATKMNRPYEVLIVDDEPGDIHLISAAIAEGKFPCNLHTAHNGLEALDYLQSCDQATKPVPDLILLDLNMPRMNGHDTLAALKARPQWSRIPVVVLTTSSADRDVGQVYDVGAAGFVTKPIELDHFIETIHGIEDYWFRVARCPPPRQ